MKLSDTGIKLLVQREGSRRRAYPDVRGIPTIGVGHTGPEVHLGLEWTQEQVDNAFRNDVQWAEDTVNETIHRPMTQNQFDAMVSLTYNIGKHGFENSTVARRFNAGDTHGAAEAFKLWNKPAVLASRRASEIQQFLKRGN